jgi:hypothetical protein
MDPFSISRCSAPVDRSQPHVEIDSARRPLLPGGAPQGALSLPPWLGTRTASPAISATTARIRHSRPDMLTHILDYVPNTVESLIPKGAVSVL